MCLFICFYLVTLCKFNDFNFIYIIYASRHMHTHTRAATVWHWLSFKLNYLNFFRGCCCCCRFPFSRLGVHVFLFDICCSVFHIFCWYYYHLICLLFEHSSTLPAIEQWTKHFSFFYYFLRWFNYSIPHSDQNYKLKCLYGKWYFHYRRIKNSNLSYWVKWIELGRQAGI